MASKYCDCGRRIVVFKSKGFKGVKSPKGDDHVLCQKCWQSERDRTKKIPEDRRITPQ